MKKAIIAISMLTFMAFAVTSVSAYHDSAVEEVSLELVEGMSTSYRVTIPEELAAFLIENGVSADLMGELRRDSTKAKELSRAIDVLKKTEPDDEDDVTLNEQFNTILAHTLGSVYADGYDPVYIDIGTVRYIRSTPVPVEDE